MFSGAQGRPINSVPVGIAKHPEPGLSVVSYVASQYVASCMAIKRGVQTGDARQLRTAPPHTEALAGSSGWNSIRLQNKSSLRSYCAGTCWDGLNRHIHTQTYLVSGHAVSGESEIPPFCRILGEPGPQLSRPGQRLSERREAPAAQRRARFEPVLLHPAVL